MERHVVIGVLIEAPDETRLEVRETNLMLALAAALDQPGVSVEWVDGDAVRTRPVDFRRPVPSVASQLTDSSRANARFRPRP